MANACSRGHEPVSLSAFGTRLKKAGYEQTVAKVANKSTRVWLGLGLPDEPPESTSHEDDVAF